MAEEKQPEKKKLTKKSVAADIEAAHKDIANFQASIFQARGIINYLTGLLKNADLPEE